MGVLAFNTVKWSGSYGSIESWSFRKKLSFVHVDSSSSGGSGRTGELDRRSEIFQTRNATSFCWLLSHCTICNKSTAVKSIINTQSSVQVCRDILNWHQQKLYRDTDTKERGRETPSFSKWKKKRANQKLDVVVNASRSPTQLSLHSTLPVNHSNSKSEREQEFFQE